MASVIKTSKVAAKLWKKHGASDVSLQAVIVGEMGNLAFTVTFESFSACGTCYDAMMGDADFRKWQADAIKGGLIEWVGGNAARKVAID